MSKRIFVDGIPVSVEEGSYDEFCAKMETLNVLIEPDDWETKDQYLVYTPDTYFEHARNYLNQEPPELKKAGEKIWDLMAHIIKEYFLNMNVDVKSHRAVKALSFFLFGFHKNGRNIINMTNLFCDVEECHKNFYSVCYFEDELEEILAKMEDFMLEVKSIPKEEVEKALMGHIDGATTNEDLEEITFEKVEITEELGRKKYKVKFIAK